MLKFAIAAVFSLASSTAVLAAPFCLAITNGTPQCMYVDGASCAADAARQNGSCQVNPAEVHIPTSRVGEYCLILPGGASRCGYADGNLCARDALKEKGGCALAAGATTVRIPDAYAPNAGR